MHRVTRRRARIGYERPRQWAHGGRIHSRTGNHGNRHRRRVEARRRIPRRVAWDGEGRGLDGARATDSRRHRYELGGKGGDPERARPRRQVGQNHLPLAVRQGRQAGRIDADAALEAAAAVDESSRSSRRRHLTEIDRCVAAAGRTRRPAATPRQRTEHHHHEQSIEP